MEPDEQSKHQGDAGAGSSGAEVPLAVDLDGTLTPFDTFHLSLLRLLSRKPWRLVAMLGWLSLGKAGFKDRLAQEAIAEAQTLPMRPEVLDLIAEAKAAGRPVLLVSAADQRQVTQIADHLGIFDEAVGSVAARNLAGREKAAYLVARFGRGGFDYAGDAPPDLAVWAKARKAIAVAVSDSLRRDLTGLAVPVEHVADRPRAMARLRCHLRLLHPRSWVANLLVLCPVVLTMDPAALPAALAAFVTFCLASSGIALLGDVLELATGRVAGAGRPNPVASAGVPVADALAQVAGLLALAALIALGLPWAVLGLFLVFVSLSLGRNLVVNDRARLATAMMGVLHATRLFGGAAAIGQSLSAVVMGLGLGLILAGAVQAFWRAPASRSDQ